MVVGGDAIMSAVDRTEAKHLVDQALTELRTVPYDVLVRRYFNKSEHREVIGKSGITYQLDIEAFWDSGDEGDLRVLVAIDDGGWSAFAPLCSDFIIAPDGAFVGE